MAKFASKGNTIATPLLFLNSSQPCCSTSTAFVSSNNNNILTGLTDPSTSTALAQTSVVTAGAGASTSTGEGAHPMAVSGCLADANWTNQTFGALKRPLMQDSPPVGTTATPLRNGVILTNNNQNGTQLLNGFRNSSDERDAKISKMNDGSFEESRCVTFFVFF